MTIDTNDDEGDGDGASGRRQRVRERRLRAAGWLFLVGSGVHMIDHLRRGQGSVTEQLYVLGTVGIVVQVAVITLILTGHRSVPLFAAGAGFSLASGFAAAHWLPRWSSLSDSFVDRRVSGFSYVASGLEILGALAVGIAGTSVYWHRDQHESVVSPARRRRSTSA